jgi:hypothetical protein
MKTETLVVAVPTDASGRSETLAPSSAETERGAD